MVSLVRATSAHHQLPLPDKLLRLQCNPGMLRCEFIMVEGLWTIENGSPILLFSLLSSICPLGWCANWQPNHLPSAQRDASCQVQCVGWRGACDCWVGAAFQASYGIRMPQSQEPSVHWARELCPVLLMCLQSSQWEGESLHVLAYMRVYAYRCVCTYVHRSQMFISGVLLGHSLPYFLKQEISPKQSPPVWLHLAGPVMS